MTLRPGEVRFWQEVAVAYVRTGLSDNAMDRAKNAALSADRLVELLRERTEDPGPRPDAGRL